MDKFFQVIINGQSVLLSETQFQSVCPDLKLSSLLPSKLNNLNDKIIISNKKNITEQSQKQICVSQQSCEQPQLALVNNSLIHQITQGTLLVDSSFQNQIQINSNQNCITIKAHQLTMNEDEPTINTEDNTPVDKERKNSETEKTTDQNNKETTITKPSGELPLDVITVPPDNLVVSNNVNNNNNNTNNNNNKIRRVLLIVNCPDGQERSYIVQQPPEQLHYASVLQIVCRSVGIDDPMEAVLPDDSTSPDHSESERSDQINGTTSVNKEHLYVLSSCDICPFCGNRSYTPKDSRCQSCKKKLPTATIHFVPDGKVSGSNLTLKKKRYIKEGDQRKRKCQRKHKKDEEPVCFTISSDEEGSDSGKNNKTENGLDSEESIITEVRKKEPNITEETEAPEEAITRGVAGGGMDFSELLDSPDLEKALMQCRTVRIGSYKVVPEEKVVLSEYGIKIKVPSPKGESVTIKILRNEIVKVLVHFGKSMPVLFYYTTNRAGIKVRNSLKMPPKVDSVYFDPTSKVEMHKRIILFPDKLTDETRLFIKHIYDSQCLLEDINSQEADDILLRVKPKEIPQQPKKETQQNPSTLTPSNIQTIMVYPPPPSKGGISINTEDYACLGEDQFLNDVIIDFYLKYIVQTSLSEYDQKRTHVFSSFFYKRLTTKCSPHGGVNKYQDDPKLNAAEKRHARVKGWTKSVDLFSKDFIIIPINENSHWFLCIICYPGLTTAIRMTDNVAVPNPTRRKPKAGNITVLSGGQAPATIGATTITMVHPLPESTITLEPDDEDRDEAEGDDDDLEPNTSDEESNKDPNEDLLDDATHKTPKVTKPIDSGEPIKQPCILIFDSLARGSRSRVCATLREYLEVEYRVRHKGHKRDFSKDTLRGSMPKVPQQTNFTDCGLYVLQYVEAFFEKPITNYKMPIKMLKDWFTPEIVSRKRYEIQQLLHRLMEEQNVDINRLNLPNLGLHPDGTSPNLRYSDDDGEEEEVEDEEVEMDAEAEEQEEEDMGMEEDMEEGMEMPEGEEGHSEEEELGRNNVSERSNDFFMDKGSLTTYRQLENLPCKIEPLNISESGVHLKRKLPTPLKEVRNPRLSSRHSQLADNKKMRCD